MPAPGPGTRPRSRLLCREAAGRAHNRFFLPLTHFPWPPALPGERGTGLEPCERAAAPVGLTVVTWRKPSVPWVMLVKRETQPNWLLSWSRRLVVLSISAWKARRRSS